MAIARIAGITIERSPGTFCRVTWFLLVERGVGVAGQPIGGRGGWIPQRPEMGGWLRLERTIPPWRKTTSRRECYTPRANTWKIGWLNVGNRVGAGGRRPSVLHPGGVGRPAPQRRTRRRCSETHSSEVMGGYSAGGRIRTPATPAGNTARSAPSRRSADGSLRHRSPPAGSAGPSRAGGRRAAG